MYIFYIQNEQKDAKWQICTKDFKYNRYQSFCVWYQNMVKAIDSVNLA